jgi:hypothetical protein
MNRATRPSIAKFPLPVNTVGRHVGDGSLDPDVDAVTDRIGRPFRKSGLKQSCPLNCLLGASQEQRPEMAVDDDGSEEAIGAEKSPRNVRRFVWALLLGIAIFLALVLLYLHFHAPVISN